MRALLAVVAFTVSATAAVAPAAARAWAGNVMDDTVRKPSLQDYADRARESERDESKGLVCAECGCRDFFVVYTRPASRGRIVRRRQCRHCGKRISTTERLTGGGHAQKTHSG